MITFVSPSARKDDLLLRLAQLLHRKDDNEMDRAETQTEIEAIEKELHRRATLIGGK